MSHLWGSGWGDCHMWVRGHTVQGGSIPLETRQTSFHCSKCDIKFIHKYCIIPDIFEAMRKTGVPNSCP